MAVQLHFAHGQVEVVVQQRLQQRGIAKQLTHRAPGRFAAAQFDQRRVGQQHQACAVHRQHRVAHGGQQGIELQVAALAGEDVDHVHRLHAVYFEQRVVQFFKYGGAEGGGVDVDVRRDHLHGVQVEVAGTEQGEDFLGDADAVDEADVDAHGVRTVGNGGRQYALRRGSGPRSAVAHSRACPLPQGCCCRGGLAREKGHSRCSGLIGSPDFTSSFSRMSANIWS